MHVGIGSTTVWCPVSHEELADTLLKSAFVQASGPELTPFVVS